MRRSNGILLLNYWIRQFFFFLKKKKKHVHEHTTQQVRRQWIETDVRHPSTTTRFSTTEDTITTAHRSSDVEYHQENNDRLSKVPHSTNANGRQLHTSPSIRSRWIDNAPSDTITTERYFVWITYATFRIVRYQTITNTTMTAVETTDHSIITATNITRISTE
jgi:hypothetical protein